MTAETDSKSVDSSAEERGSNVDVPISASDILLPAFRMPDSFHSGPAVLILNHSCSA